MERPAMQELSEHAKRRAKQRGVPDFVMQLFQENAAFIAQGKRDGKVTHYHILRTGEQEYYVGVERENVAITFIRVETPYNWFRRRLLNFDHMYQQIRSLSISRDPEKKRRKNRRLKENKKKNKSTRRMITEELAELFGVDVG